MPRGYNYSDRDGYRGGYPDRGQSGYGREQAYEMSRRQTHDPRDYDRPYDDRRDRRRYDDYDRSRGGGGGGYDNRGYYPEDDVRGSSRNGRMEKFDDIDSKQPKKGRKKGKEEYNPSRKGPIKNRSCTDIICCFLFLAFIAGLAVVAYFAYVSGDPRTLLYPQNSDGELCGVGNQKGRPKLFFFDLIQCARVGPGVMVNGCPTPQICVSECPNENYFFLQSSFRNRSKLICKNGVNRYAKELHELILDEDCAPYYLNSTAIFGRCLPIKDLLTVVGAAEDTFEGSDGNLQNLTGLGGPFNMSTLKKTREVFEYFFNATELGEKVITDVHTSWWMILIALGLACLISLIWIVLMRWIAGIMVWVTVVAFVLLWAGGAAYSFYEYFNVEDPEESYYFQIMVIQMEFQKKKFFLGMGIVAGVIFLIVFLIFLFLIVRIRIAIALIEEGSRAIGSMIFTLLWPIFPFIFQLAVIGLWGTIAVYLASVGRVRSIPPANVTFPNGTIDVEAAKARSPNLFDGLCNDEILPTTNTSLGDFCTAVRYNGDQYTIYLQIYNVFMLFWLMNFVIAFGQMTLAGAFASYYWAWDKKRDIPTFPLLASMWRCLRYHLGTLAFGSLIIAIVQIIRLALEYIDSKLKGTENPVGKFFIKCLKCCFWCLEKFLRFLNKNAYIMTAVYGKNFCSAARKAFMLILANVVRVVVVDKVTDFILFIAKLVVVGAVGVSSYFFFDGRIPFLQTFTPSLHFYLVPIIIIVIATYVIAKAFFSVYDMAVDTLFLCFLMDLDKNDGSEEKPYFMSKNLKKILGKKNKAPPAQEEDDRADRRKKSRK